MNWQELTPYLRQGNTPYNRFLGHVDGQDDLGPTLVGLVNGCGGSVVIGMDLRNYHLYGCDKTQEWVNQLIASHCIPSFSCDAIQVSRGGKTLLLITVPEGTKKPYYYKRKCYTISPDTGELKVERELQVIPEEPVQTEIAAVQVVQVEEQPQPSAPVGVQPMTYTSSNMGDVEAISAKRPEKVRQSWKDRINADGLNRRQKKLITYLQRRNSIRNMKYRELYGVSHKTAHLELVEMLQKDILVQKGAGRSTRYVLKEKEVAAIAA